MALSSAVYTSPLFTKAYNELMLLRNIGLTIDLDANILYNDTAIIELNKNEMTTRFGNEFNQFYDSMHLTTVKGSMNIRSAISSLYPNHVYTYGEGSSSTQLGLGWTQRSAPYGGFSLNVYMATKKTSVEFMQTEMQYPGSNTVMTYAPVMKTSTGISKLNYDSATTYMDGRKAQWVVYARRKTDNAVVVFCLHNHQEALMRIHHFNAPFPLASYMYFARLNVKATYDAFVSERSRSVVFSLMPSNYGDGAMDGYQYDYAHGIDALVGSEHVASFRNASKWAIFNDEVYAAVNKAHLFVSAGTHNVNVQGFELELMQRKPLP